MDVIAQNSSAGTASILLRDLTEHQIQNLDYQQRSALAAQAVHLADASALKLLLSYNADPIANLTASTTTDEPIIPKTSTIIKLLTAHYSNSPRTTAHSNR